MRLVASNYSDGVVGIKVPPYWCGQAVRLRWVSHYRLCLDPIFSSQVKRSGVLPTLGSPSCPTQSSRAFSQSRLQSGSASLQSGAVRPVEVV